MTVKEKGFSLLYRKILPSFNFSFLFLHKNQWLSQTSYEVIYYEYYSVRRGLYLSKGWLLQLGYAFGHNQLYRKRLCTLYPCFDQRRV